MICVHKYGNYWNNYDVTGKPEKEGFLNLWELVCRLYFTEINSYPS